MYLSAQNYGIALLGCAGTGFVFTVFLVFLYLQAVKKLQVGQFIREEGPKSHAGKARTPTMGGVCFMVPVLVVSCLWLQAYGIFNADSMLCLSVAGCCGLLGLADDLAKTLKASNSGISGYLRLAVEACLGLALGCCMLALSHGANAVFLAPKLIYGGGMTMMIVVLPPALYMIAASFYVAASCNALNLHDGLDGLAAGTSTQVLLCLALLLLWTDQPAPAFAACAAAGAVFGFLCFNRYPARVFMGDAGSLFIGGLLGSLAVTGRLECWFIPLAIIYILEVLSVIVQVVVFKLTKPVVSDQPTNPLSLAVYKLTHRLPGEGRRVFRMAPIHHHFESVLADRGVSEPRVVAGFWLAQLVVCSVVAAVFRHGY